MNKMFSLLLATISMLQFGCSTIAPSKVINPASSLYADTYFIGETKPPETEDEIFKLPDSIKAELHKTASQHNIAERKAKAVLELIFSYADDGLLYDNASTRTAAETLAYGKANCLSLSILAYSMAKEVDMTAIFQDVQIPEYWTSEMNQSWLNGHVNLKIRQDKILNNATGMSLLGRDIVVDFDPYSLKNRFPEYEIPANRIVAMFHNNKAASALSEGDINQAYRYFKAAINADPQFAVTWSNLAVLYRIKGLYELAEKTYEFSLSLKPNAINTLSNLAYLYRIQNKYTESKKLEQLVLSKRRTNPYYYLMLGNEAYKTASFTDAIKHFNQSLSLKTNNHEALFGLAKTYYQLKEYKRSASFFNKAIKTATSLQDQRRYEHKLSILNQIAQN